MLDNIKMDKGFIVGKFLPAHIGHQALIEYGSCICKELIVIVDHFENETIDNNLRVSWLKEVFKDKSNILITTFDKYMPQNPEEPFFWEIWQKEVLNITGRLDCVIASETYGEPLAKVLNAKFIPFNIKRNLIDISATRIKTNMNEYFDYLVQPAKKYFSKKFCLVGPESTGKTTVSKELFNLFENSIDISYIAEYAEDYCTYNKNLTKEDLLTIAASQQFFEDHIKYPVSILDSDILSTSIWNKILFNDNSLDNLIPEDNRIYFLFDYKDTPYIEDTHRDCLENARDYREEFFKKFEEVLIKKNKKYYIVSGTLEERYDFVYEKIIVSLN